jgi:hypothetical protein
MLLKRAEVEHTRMILGKFIKCPSFSRLGSRR